MLKGFALCQPPSICASHTHMGRLEADARRSQCSHTQRAIDPMKHLAKRLSYKLEEGDYRGAIRLASLEDSVGSLDSDTLRALSVDLQVIRPIGGGLAPHQLGCEGSSWVRVRSPCRSSLPS